MPGHPRLSCCYAIKTWMPGTSSAKTRFALLHGHDEVHGADSVGCNSSHTLTMRMLAPYFSSAAVDVAGPSPTIKSTASSSLAPSQCTCLPKCVTKLPAGIAVVLAGSNFGPEPTHQVPCNTAM